MAAPIDLKPGDNPFRGDAVPETNPSSTFDRAEVDRFAALADDWWNPHGKFRPLHDLGPERLAFIRDSVTRQLGVPGDGLKPLAGIRILDVGCGGGLIAEPLARMGAAVTAIDPAEPSIAAARLHAEANGVTVDYRAARAEDLVAAGATFDAVTCMEVIEHVPDVGAFVALLAGLVRPGGLLVLSTINRTLKAYAMAIVATEYVLQWLPRGTHQWDRFVTPEELERHLRAAGLVQPTFEGLVYHPLGDRWSRASDLDVNYMAAAARPA